MTPWYHGGSGEMVDAVLAGKRIKTSDPEDHALRTAIPGRFYITKDLEYAVMFTVGYGMAKTEGMMNPVGGLLEVGMRDESLLWPDEDEIGRIVAMGYGITEHEYIEGYPHWRYKYIDDKRKGQNEEYLGLYRKMSGYFSQDILNILEEYHEFLEDYDLWIRVGKAMIEILLKEDPRLLHKIALSVPHVSTPPNNIIVLRAWKIDNVKYRDFATSFRYSNFFDYAEPINISRPIVARGIGKGWYREKYRHALAARGIKTR